MTKFLVTIALILSMPLWAMAQSDIVKIASNHDVSMTMDRFEKIVQEKGMAVFSRINHQQNAAQAGMSMGPAQVLIFGNPRLGTTIMQKDPAAGLDLPLRILVYEDAEGQAWLSYHNPLALKSSYDLGGVQALNKAAAAMEAISAAATK